MSDLDLVLLVLVATVFLVIVAMRLRSFRPRPARVTRQVKFKINGVTYNNLAEIPDARIRKVAEDALKIKLT
jgi:hypothetical protein